MHTRKLGRGAEPALRHAADAHEGTRSVERAQEGLKACTHTCTSHST